MTKSSKHHRSKKQIQIVETGERLFRNYGIKKVTVEEICAEAHVSKMTFYKYFTNKLELVKYIISQWYNDGLEITDNINAMDIPVTEKLRRMIEWKLEFISDMSPAFVNEFVHFDAELSKFIDQKMTKTVHRFLEYIEGWQKSGEVRPGIRPELILAALGKIHELFKDNRLRSFYRDHVEFTHELHSFFFYGIVNSTKTETYSVSSNNKI